MDEPPSLQEFSERLGHEPTLTFATEGEDVFGPMAPRKVTYGKWGNYEYWMPMLSVHLNKYHPNLPEWMDVVEVFLASEEMHGLVKVARTLSVTISGRLKTVQLGVSAAFPHRRGGDIIPEDDVAQNVAQSASEDFRVDGVLE